MAIKDIFEAVLDTRMEVIEDLVRAEVDAGTDIDSILNEGLIAPMEKVGHRFSEGLIFVPEMLFSAEVMKKGLEILKPHMTKTAGDRGKTIIVGTVYGDLHDIGKNLVVMMLQSNGFGVVDLGINVPKEKFVEAVRGQGPKTLALSALLTTTLPAMQEAVANLKREVPDVKIMVGGAPVTREFADRIGADGYGADAPAAVDLAKGFFCSGR